MRPAQHEPHLQGVTINRYDENNMRGPSIETELCPFCGRPASNRHHIVPRSRGGHKGPTVTVCGMGNTSGCHRLLHDHRLHLRWSGETWEYLVTAEPTKYEKAFEKEGWRNVNAD